MELYHVLMFLSLVMETLNIFSPSTNLGIAGRLFTMISGYFRVMRRYIIYFILISLGNITHKYVHVSIPVEAVVYMVEVVALLHFIRDGLKDTMIKSAIDTLLNIIEKKSLFKVKEPKEEESKSDGDIKQ